MGSPPNLGWERLIRGRDSFRERSRKVGWMAPPLILPVGWLQCVSIATGCSGSSGVTVFGFLYT